MPKLLQINVCSNIYSTGKICEDIAQIAQRQGWETFIAYGGSHKMTVSQEYRIAGKWNNYVHYAEFRLFDREGLSSRIVTRKFIKWIQYINPDIVHIHNIHDHWINYPILFNYLYKTNKPVVWTQHDCWAFTGGCMYFDMLNCNKWKKGCTNCPQNRAILFNRGSGNLRLKDYFCNRIKNLTFVSVSFWMEKLLRDSIYKHRPIITIHNGIDLEKFRPLKSNSRDIKPSLTFKILGVASTWDKRKGLNDFVKLRENLDETFEIILVGLSKKQILQLPKGITGLAKTSNLDEMIRLYSDADVFVNPTYSDNFPTTNIEALACGTPVITYQTGGSPEAIDAKTGVVVSQSSLDELILAITNIKKKPLSAHDCRVRAETFFDKYKCFEQYVKLYNSILNNEKNGFE